MNNKNKIRVILDTNFLLIPGQFKVDIFEEINRLINYPYELCIFEKSFEELKKIMSKNSKDKQNAKVALELIKQKNLKILKNSLNEETEYLDDIILKNVSDLDIVCTQDRFLRKKLKNKWKKIKIISLKTKNYLDFI